APLLDDHQTCVHGHIRGVIHGEQVTMPVTHLRLPLARVARSPSRTIVRPDENFRRVNLMQRHEGRFRCVDRLEALAGAESRDGQQPALVSGVPEIPLSTPRGFEQRHLHHVDHTLSPRMCPAVYHVFSFRFHKSKPIDLIRNPNLVNAAILAVYPDIWAAVYINELMAIPPCHASPILRPNIELMGTQLVLRWLPMLCVRVE